MAEPAFVDGFRLGRLRLIRLPPSSISLPASGSKKPNTAQIELAVGVTDDYGTDLMFDSVDLRIDVLDAGTLKRPTGVTFRLANSSSSSSSDSTSAIFSFSPSNGPFHTVKLSLSFQPSLTAGPIPPSLSFRLSVASPSPPTPTEASGATRCIRTLVGELDQAVLEMWDDKRYVLMSVRSGPVEVKSEGKEVKLASEKVQTTLRTIHLPSTSLPPSDSAPSDPSSTSLPPSSSPRSISIVERPGLNNSTGQRLWDCAIGMSAFLSLFPHALDAAAPLPAIDSHGDEPSLKQRRVESGVKGRRRRIRVVELGAGCALASMVASRILESGSGADTASVLATDVEATIETTLKENLEANSAVEAVEAVEAAVLDWGELSQDTVDRVTQGKAHQSGTGGQDDETSLTLLATDVLYNPSSHDLLLSNLLSLLRPHSPSTTLAASRRALIAYKRRTEGDDGFFSLAKDTGLEVTKVWEWGEVSVWSLV
ncbi:VMP4 protein [Rhodotorula toruloides ATCC 204091]|uniref:VMP4 protein n=1 Tax=Rhodotorula toruloides TaxID=5286 RepID=A0A0K3CA49_RHOTO|nr:VMP4 protein [Rhodotorula toruloides ATCC 204091]KAK4333585.1 VMP4 protein [Rhodotorula toruloides]PRQ74776.1 VMP4 protein [Rhodotorula toruloides]